MPGGTGYHGPAVQWLRVQGMRVGWSTVSAIISRLVARLRDGDPLDSLTDIGIDELSYRKHYEYITVVFDHRKQRAVWAAPGKNAATV